MSSINKSKNSSSFSGRDSIDMNSITKKGVSQSLNLSQNSNVYIKI